MASSGTARVEHFQLVDGMQLKINVSGSLNGPNVRIELRLKNCTRAWILHWGFVNHGNPNWFIPSEQSPGSKSYKQGALQTPFTKSGEFYVVNMELRGPKFHAIEFVLKDSCCNRWLKLNNGNFRVDLPEHDESTIHPSLSKDLIERKAYQIWESKGRPTSTPHQQKRDYDDAVRELQSQLAKGISLNELQSSCMSTSTKTLTDNRGHSRCALPPSYRRRHDVDQWLHKHSVGHAKSTNMPFSALMDLVERTNGGDKVISRQSYHVGNYEIVAPPSDMLPERSRLLNGACQTYFAEILTGKGSFQLVDINLQQRNFFGIQFMIWTGGSWIKNNGANFSVLLKSINPNGKVDGDGKEIVKWLLDEIYRREKEAERSLMHRFNIATELTERCKFEGESGLIGILVWLRFMACRHLTWNKNYNVKPREISEAQDKFTNLLQKIYVNQPNDGEIVRLIMLCVGRGGQGDVGQRIRDEILVLQALLNYVRCGFRIDVYWQTLNANGLTKEKLASYDRPIVSEPHFNTHAKEGLIRDLTMYLKTLKAVHSGADLESAIETCLGPSCKSDFTNVERVNSLDGLSQKLRESLNFIRANVADANVASLMEKLLESRIELHPVLLTSTGRAKDLLFLDLALDSAVRTTMERGLKDISFDHLPDIMCYISFVLENLCLSIVNNEDLIYCTKGWYLVCESYKSNDVQWALQAKSILDRVQLILADRSQNYQKKIQPSVQYLGNLLGIKKWVIDIFTEELIRAGSAAILSTLINRFDPILRKIANLGCWQVISPVEVCGFVTSVHELITIQNKVYGKPTVIIANRVTGEEEIPDGVVAVLTPNMPDILSHVSIRARNSKVCFAACFDQNILRNLKLKEGKAISISMKSMNLIISDVDGSNLSLNSSISTSIPRAVTLKRKLFCGKYAISLEEFTAEMVGAKSCNIKFLRERVPSWIKIPISVALTFGAFETILLEDINKDIASRISCFYKSVLGGDLTKLRAIQDTYELKSKMRSSRIPWPGDEGEERWNRAWQAIKKIVKGLGETLVGAYPGRSMSFITRKSNLKFPIVTGYPSKNIGLYSKQSIIFRSDSNGEDLEGYAGAGLYDSALMDEEEKVILDYSSDRLMVDKAFQTSIFSKIAEAGKIIEGLCGCPQDIEGVVKDGVIYVVQARPQF
ncbi:hypothetical protein P3X46_002505 [Hevea brasiliensis]|uniref:Pyruvate phosphate dikinase AMP/ATP-binding domain-containing protein n=1 Tax=Hevea brasiliensis TaxID=3981 RepID=A0ABQ9N4Y9_HEVBR|nr:hypothetical protein P3X46_002505 [Hevea brasiliensis]